MIAVPSCNHTYLETSAMWLPSRLLIHSMDQVFWATAVEALSKTRTKTMILWRRTTGVEKFMVGSVTGTFFPWCFWRLFCLDSYRSAERKVAAQVGAVPSG